MRPLKKNQSLKRVSLMFFVVVLVTAGGTRGLQGQQGEATITLMAAQFELDRLAPGQTSGEAVFMIDPADVITVNIIASTGNLTTSIVGPAGQIVDEDTIMGLGGEFVTFEGAAVADSPVIVPSFTPGFHFIFTFPSLGAGEYTVRFEADPSLAEEVAVITEVTTDSPVGAALFVTEPVLPLGNPAVLIAAVFEGETAVVGADVSAFIMPQTGPTVELTLLDNGSGADAAAGDGLYSGEFTASEAGQFDVAGEISATTTFGAPFFREVGTEFRVVEPTSTLTGTVTDQGVDDNGNGLLERVVIRVGTDTTQAGDHRVFVTLTTATGQELLRSGEANLQAGTGTIEVDFEADAFLALGEDGPYNIALIELVFLGPDGALPAGRLVDVGQTQPFLLSQFERPALALTGVTSDEGIDDDGNGRFDRLLVTVQVDVVDPGFYNWTLKLTGQDLNQIDFAAGSGTFTSGLNNIVVEFDGLTIGTFGADGPYLLRDLLLIGPTASLVVTDAGQTQAFRVAQFEGGNAPPIADAGPDLVVAGTSDEGTQVTLDGSASVDPEGDPLTFTWTGPFPEGDGTLTTTDPTVTVTLDFGTSIITLVVNDGTRDSAPDTLEITISDFAVGVDPERVTVTAGQNATYTITVSPQFGAFDNAVTLECSDLPASTSCSFSPSELTPGDTALTSTLTVSTTGSRAFLVPPLDQQEETPLNAFWLGVPGLALAGAMLVGGRSKKRRLGFYLSLGLLLALLTLQVACGNGEEFPLQVATPSGSHTFTVTGTSGSLQRSVTATLVVR